MKFSVSILSVMLCISSSLTQAQRIPYPDRHMKADTAIDSGLRGALSPVKLDAPIVTHHSGVFNGKRIQYSAAVEPIVVPDSSGKPAARLVTITYTADNATPNRPVLFAFNGGPISTSTPLHMTLLGPKRIAIPDDITADPSTFKVVDNAYAPLDVADVVMFDPAGMGWSRALSGVDLKSFFSVDTDARELTGLVNGWSRLHGRVNSPKYLIGESYGTLRAAQAALQLQSTDTPLAGIVLLGQAVNIIEYAQRPLNTTSYAVSLPTLAAIAWSHHRAAANGRTFDQFMKDVLDYSAGEYLHVLYLGDTAPQVERQAVASKLQELTGLTADWYLAHALRITKEEYRRILFPGQLLGMADARYIGPVEKGDPFNALIRVFGRSFHDYARTELQVPQDIGDYNTDNPAPNDLNGWDWGENKSPFGDWPYTQMISQVFGKNPNFKVMVCNGYYDTQTTVGAMNLLVNQSGWPPERVRTHAYQGGHVFYTVEASAKQATDDIRAMLNGTW